MSSRHRTRLVERRAVVVWLAENGYPEAAKNIEDLRHYDRSCVDCGAQFNDQHGKANGRPAIRCETHRRSHR